MHKRKTMKKMIVATAVATTMAMAGGDIIVAETQVAPVETKDFYVGISTMIGSGDDHNKLEWFERTTVGAQAGWIPFRSGNFSTALEARYSTDTQNFGDAYTAGAFVKPTYSFENASVYALAGYTTIVADNGSFGDNDGFAYGAGVATPFIMNTELFADYVRNDNPQFDTVTVGVNYKF